MSFGNRIRLAAAAVVVALGTSACTEGADGTSANLFSDLQQFLGGSDNQALTPAQQDLRDRQRNYAQARIAGAVAGALAGGLACALIGDCDARTTAAAALGGGVAGYAGAGYLVRRDQRFVASSDSLYGDIEQAKAESSELRQDIASARRVLNYQKYTIGRLDAQYEAGVIELSAYRAQVQNMREDLEATRTLRSDGERRVASLQSTLATYEQGNYYTSALRTQLNQQRQSVQTLREIEAEMLMVINGAAPEALS